METDKQKNGHGRGKGRGNLDTLESDVERAMLRTPEQTPGPTAEQNRQAVIRVKIPHIQKQVLTLVVKNEAGSPLVTHRFPHGALYAMLKGKNETEDRKKDKVLPERIPDTEFRLALYVYDREERRLICGPDEIDRFKDLNLTVKGYSNFRKRYAFVLPARMFKDALVGATKYTEGITAAYVKQVVHVFGNLGDWCEIESPRPPVMREDIVQIGPWNNKSPQLRFRPQFDSWSTTLKIRFLSNFMTDEQIGALVQYAGATMGVAEMRPEKSGLGGGMFIVETK